MSMLLLHVRRGSLLLLSVIRSLLLLAIRGWDSRGRGVLLPRAWRVGVSYRDLL